MITESLELDDRLYFHGTPSRTATRILQKGFKVPPGTEGIWIAHSFEEAHDHGKNTAWAFGLPENAVSVIGVKVIKGAEPIDESYDPDLWHLKDVVPLALVLGPVL